MMVFASSDIHCRPGLNLKSREAREPFLVRYGKEISKQKRKTRRHSTK
jgi:hypothetical protein